MTKINIVLVEPEIPQNTGNIARTCSATGAALHLVYPMGFVIDDRKLKRAGLDYWNTLEIYMYDSLADFMEKHGNDNLWFYTTKASKLYTEARTDENGEIYLVFGKETRGLPEELTSAHFDRSVRIPMLSDKRSLNLSNSAAIAVYEILRQTEFAGLKTDGERLGALLADARSENIG
ncbi:MAG: tRNA (cytidine(34)-2'-O)-methyltransferase [Clostridia bacterium]|nr:tRNA (cytidine(34)-2'-O)-methyltransferase [Clostridia bacterium]